MATSLVCAGSLHVTLHIMSDKEPGDRGFSLTLPDASLAEPIIVA